MKFVSLLSLVMSLSVLTGCSSLPKTDAQPTNASMQTSLKTAYDYQLLDTSFNQVSFQQALAELKSYDVVFIGEYHGNQASHLLEMQMLAALHQHNQQIDRPTQLSMEMFNRDQKTNLDNYIDGEIGERYLIKETPAWRNYAGSYRPLVEYAKANFIPVIAANAAADLVRCIGRQGEAYYDKMDAEEKTYIAEQPFATVEGYEEKFFSFMSGSKHMPKKRQRNGYLAQLTRDNTMAESIHLAMQQTENSQVVHLNGSFHSEEHLGTVGALKRMNPKLRIAVVTPVHLQNLDEVKAKKRKDEFYYLLNPQPQEFVDSDYKRKVRKAMFDKAKEKAKSCK
jgi:uncharacterized iron-regulated protein